MNSCMSHCIILVDTCMYCRTHGVLIILWKNTFFNYFFDSGCPNICWRCIEAMFALTKLCGFSLLHSVHIMSSRRCCLDSFREAIYFSYCPHFAYCQMLIDSSHPSFCVSVSLFSLQLLTVHRPDRSSLTGRTARGTTVQSACLWRMQVTRGTSSVSNSASSFTCSHLFIDVHQNPFINLLCKIRVIKEL